MSVNLNSTPEVTALEQELEVDRRRCQELAAALEEAKKAEASTRKRWQLPRSGRKLASLLASLQRRRQRIEWWLQRRR